MENNEKPGFFSVLPGNVRYSSDIPSLAKFIFSEITALCDKTGSCWAGNTYFANLYEVRPETISRNIKKLEKQGHIYITYKKRGTQIVERCISLMPNVDFTIDENVNGTIDENVNGTIDENVKENNTRINNKRNIKEKKDFKIYGEFENVYLTDTELDKLKTKFADYLDRIENLSSYMSSQKKKYNNHYATILVWHRRDLKTKKVNNEQPSNYRKL